MMKKRAMTNKQGGGVKAGAGKESRAEEMNEAKMIQSGKMSPSKYADMESREGYKNGGKVMKCADGGIVWDRTQGTGVRSNQDYKK